jgi:hypothetical protein
MSSGESRHRSRHYSLRAKQDAVLRVVKGEPATAVAEDVGVGINRLERWHSRFMEGGAAALNKRASRPGLYETLRTHGSEIMQWGALLVVLTVLVFFLVRILN